MKCDDAHRKGKGLRAFAQSRDEGANLTDGFAASVERVMEFVMARERWVR